MSVSLAGRYCRFQETKRRAMIAMVEVTVEYAQATLEVFGLPALVVIFVLKGALIGKPLPTSVFLPGYVLAVGATYWYAAVIVLVVTAAHVVGQFVIYGGCRLYGLAFLACVPSLKYDRDDGELQRLERWFDRYGGLSVFVTNVVPWTRGLLAIPAGVAAYPLGRYTFHVVTSTLLYHGAYVALALVGLAVV